MARRSQDEDELFDDELAAAFLSDDDAAAATNDSGAATTQPAATSSLDELDDTPMTGQLAVDVYETKDKLIVKARTAGINKNDLDVSLSDNTLSVRGTLSAGHEEGAENYFLQECYWGEFSRSIVLPVPVQEDNIEAMLKDGVLTIGFTKVQQDTVKKIPVL